MGTHINKHIIEKQTWFKNLPHKYTTPPHATQRLFLVVLTKYFLAAMRTYLLVSRKRWIRLIDGGGPYCSSQATRAREQSHLLKNVARYYARAQEMAFVTNNL